MTVSVQPVRGMNDVLPAQITAWQQLESVTRQLFAAYGYEEIRLPLVEHTELFKRSIGEFTDIVEKEMYTFEDSGGASLTLRPEATAGVVRAAITNGLLRGALDAMGVPYSVEPRLVRGLDYYSRTAFERVTDALGSQDAICGGGRYD